MSTTAARKHARREPNIEITPEMIEAGADLIWRHFGDVVAYGGGLVPELASEVYRAMARARPKARIVLLARAA
jgi:hypothetical protein